MAKDLTTTEIGLLLIRVLSCYSHKPSVLKRQRLLGDVYVEHRLDLDIAAGHVIASLSGHAIHKPSKFPDSVS